MPGPVSDAVKEEIPRSTDLDPEKVIAIVGGTAGALLLIVLAILYARKRDWIKFKFGRRSDSQTHLSKSILY